MAIATGLAVSLVAGLALDGLENLERQESYRQIIRSAAVETLQTREYDTGLDPVTILEVFENTPIGPSAGGELMDVGNRNELVMRLGKILTTKADVDQTEGVELVRDLITNVEREIAAEAGPGFSVILQYVQDIAENTEKHDEQLRALANEIDEGHIAELSETWDRDLRTLDTRTRRSLETHELDGDATGLSLREQEYERVTNAVDVGGDILLRGPAGAGKTTLVRTLVREWRETDRGAAYLVNARDLNTEATLGENLNLSHAPIQILETAADELNHVLLVLDQLDSVHDEPIIHEIEDLVYEAVDTEGLTVVCVARDWELEHGRLLRDSRERLGEVRLDDLPREAVAEYLRTLGVQEAQQTNELASFVTTPLRLRLLEGVLEHTSDEEAKRRDFGEITSDIQLWDAYYESLNERESTTTNSLKEGTKITACASALAREASLSGPEVSIADNDTPPECPTWVIQRLQSRGVIRPYPARDKQVAFSHDELQAYLYARSLVERGRVTDLIDHEKSGHLTATGVLDWTVRLLAEHDSELLRSFVRDALAPNSGLDYYPAIVVLDSLQASYEDPESPLTEVVWTQLEPREHLSAYFFRSIKNDAWLDSYHNAPYGRAFTSEEVEAIYAAPDQNGINGAGWAKRISDQLSLATKANLPIRVGSIDASTLRSEIMDSLEEVPLADIPRDSVWELFDHLVEQQKDQFALVLAKSLFDKFAPASLPAYVSLDNAEHYILDAHIWEGTKSSFQTLYERQPKETRQLFEKGLDHLETVADARNVSIPLDTFGIDGGFSTRSNSTQEVFNIRNCPALIGQHLSFFIEIFAPGPNGASAELSQSTVRDYLERGDAFREFGRAVIAAAPDEYPQLVQRELTDPETYGPGVSHTTTLALLDSAFDMLDQTAMQEVVDIIDSLPCEAELKQVQEELDAEVEETVELEQLREYWKVTHFASIYDTAKHHTDYSALERVVLYEIPSYLDPVPTRESQRYPIETLPEGEPEEVVAECNKAAQLSRQSLSKWHRPANPLSRVSNDFADRVRENPGEYLPALTGINWDAKTLLSRSLRWIAPEIDAEHLSPLLDAVEHCFEHGDYAPDPRAGVEERRTALRCCLDIIRYEHLAETALEEYGDRIRELAERGLTDPDPGLDLEDDRPIPATPRGLAESRVRSLSFLILSSIVDTDDAQQIIAGVITDTETAVQCALGMRLPLLERVDDDAGVNHVTTLLERAGDNEWLIWTAFLTMPSVPLEILERYEDRVRDSVTTLGGHATAEPGSVGPTHDLLDTDVTRAIFSMMTSIYETRSADLDREALVNAYLRSADDQIIGDSVTDCWKTSDHFEDWWRFRLESEGEVHPGRHELAAYMEHLSGSAEEFNPSLWSELIERSIPRAVKTQTGWSALVEYLHSHAETTPRRSAELLRQAVVKRPTSDFDYLGTAFNDLEQALLEEDSSSAIMKEIMKQIAPQNEAVETRLRRLD